MDIRIDRTCNNIGQGINFKNQNTQNRIRVVSPQKNVKDNIKENIKDDVK